MNEKQRIRQILKGDTFAFAYFVETYQDMAVNIAFRICKNRMEAEDIAQISFVKAFKNLHSFKKQSKFSTWFYQIVYNTALTEIRKSVHKTEFVEFKHSNFKSETSGFDTLESISTDERRILIDQALSQLHESEALILTLFYLEENSIKEVAEIMGLTPVNIRVKLHRARKNFAALFNEEIPEEFFI